MKMITKVFLVIAVLLICLITWVLFLDNDDGIIPRAWNSIATSVNETWESLTGSEGPVPEWKTKQLDDAQKELDGDNGAGSGGGGGGGN